MKERMPEVGSPAPPFVLPDADMQMVKLSDFKGKNVVLYFYPKNDTPGCTKQAIDFTELADEFTRLNTEVVGISKDDCLSHASFRDKHGLTIQLLADTEGEVCETYGVWQEKEKDGQKKMGIVRSTFLIDQAGILRHALYGVNPKGHALEIMNLVKAF